MPGNRHAKQHSTVLSAHERKAMGWGRKSVRLGANSMGDFDACRLCIKQAVDPLSCKKGNIYCKECIYQFLVGQKQHKRKQLKLWEQQQAAITGDSAEQEDDAKRKVIADFQALQSGILPADARVAKKRKVESKMCYAKVTTPQGGVAYVIDRDLISEMHAKKTKAQEKADALVKATYNPSFWLPSMTPDEGVRAVKKPSKKCSDPFGNAIKKKDLIPVKFTLSPDAIKAKKDYKTGRYICPISRKTLTNSSKCQLIASTGHVISDMCVKLILEEGSYEGTKVRKKDIIKINAGGTGFAANGSKMAKSDEFRIGENTMGIFW